MVTRYQETVHVHNRHNDFLAQCDNKSKSIREALDLLMEREGFKTEETDLTEVPA